MSCTIEGFKIAVRNAYIFSLLLIPYNKFFIPYTTNIYEFRLQRIRVFRFFIILTSIQNVHGNWERELGGGEGREEIPFAFFQITINLRARIFADRHPFFTFSKVGRRRRETGSNERVNFVKIKKNR